MTGMMAKEKSPNFR